MTVFSGKVDLGTGVETALAQIVAEELDVPFKQIKMIGLDTTKAIDQGVTAGSRTIERGGPQLRQAAAAARQELSKARRRPSQCIRGHVDREGRRCERGRKRSEESLLRRTHWRQTIQCKDYRHRHRLGYESRAGS